jgi:exopolysaccharide biosynthesis polyprenyl glycosylphosphotransferase
MEEIWERSTYSGSSVPRWVEGSAGSFERRSLGPAKLWMALDAITVLVAVALATFYKMHTGPLAAAREFWQGTLIKDPSREILLVLLCGFCVTLILTSRRLNLYTPRRLSSMLHEQRLSVQACLHSGMLLAGALYLLRAEDIPRSIVLITVGLVTIFLSLRRLVYRIVLHHNFRRGIGTRNVLIVGTGPEALALRHHLERIRHLGYSFKGFIHFPGANSSAASSSGDVIGTLETLFQNVRQLFVDEIFFTVPCERGIIQDVLVQARIYGVDLRMVPEMYDDMAWNSPIEYIGNFPTIPLRYGQLPEMRLILKRGFDIVFSSLALLVLSPLLLALAVAVKLDSPGPALYCSDRLSKKGRVFRCLKFRTMVRDAEERHGELKDRNERDGVLFKITNDPRVTRVGRYLRKYSLDELPQFLNVIHGDMSIVGPRPAVASEVREYELSHLRRLDVMPGITGLWQVQARQDPSFDSYISLDMAYIENWSFWLDLKIIMRTVGVVFAGTGS